MKDAKKTEKANLEHRRKEMFLVALVLILSALYCALGWNTAFFARDDGDAIEDMMEDIDIDELKKDLDMVAAVQDEESGDDADKVVVTDEAERQEDLDQMTQQEDESGQEGGEDEKKEDEEQPQLLITNLNDRESLVVMERLPEFPGGASAFMKWLTANLKYPKAAQQKKIRGKVVVSFIVDAEGNTTKLKLEETDNRQLGSAVMSVMAKMPKWKPGVEDGKVCATMIKVPINFEL